MVQISVPNGPKIDLCTKSEGLWFDKNELNGFTTVAQEVQLAVDPGFRNELSDSATTKASFAAGAALLALPNLLLRSTLTLIGLYCLLGIVLIAAVEFAGLPINGAVVTAVIIVLFQFLIGPFMMDLSLRWLYRMNWVELDKLPDHLEQFIRRVSEEQGIKPPKMGIIEDGAPQAFTYGHTPNNARIVISRGLINILEPEETEAVVAHEIGHAVHWDMFLMTVVQLVPLLIYYIYRMLLRASRNAKKEGAAGAIAVAIGAYIIYMVSQYIVLWFSRTREYHADRFAGTVTGQPGHLSSALVKIAYGLVERKKSSPDDEERNDKTDLGAVGALGIFDSGAALSLAITSFAGRDAHEGGEINKDALRGAMRWDIWNPWAKWYELNSTHPLVANRLRHLSNQAQHVGIEPFITFDERRPESYWDEFAIDFSILALPWLIFSGAVAYLLAIHKFGFDGDVDVILPIACILFGAALYIKNLYKYRGGRHAPMSVSALLKKVKISPVRPVRCELRGKVIGRGVPGLIISEDFVLRDETGFIFLDFNQPLAIWNMLFGLLKAGKYVGHDVVAKGWYRRAPVPYLEVETITMDGADSTAFTPKVAKLFPFIWILGGVIGLISLA